MMILMKYSKKLQHIEQSAMQERGIIDMIRMTLTNMSGRNFVPLLMNTEPTIACPKQHFIRRGMRLICILHPLLHMISASQNQCNTLFQSLDGMPTTAREITTLK